ncbi:ornithine cyclodeaminase family protein [Tsuneonella sp. HG249]
MVSPADVLEVIAGAFVDPPIAPPRAIASCRGDGVARTLLAMPALRPGGIAIVKVVHSACGGLNSHLLAFDTCGTLLAVVEAHRLTALRTAAASVLAARTLRVGGARSLAVLGAGRQARAHVEAYAAAFPIEKIAIWARRNDAARELAAFAADHVAAVRVESSPAEAAANADIVACATPSTNPLVTGDMIGPRTHVDLVGGFRPDMREVDDTLMCRASIVADTAAALTEAGDLVQPLAAGVITRDQIVLLKDILAGRVPAPCREVTVFKSVGHAAEDLVVMELLLAGLGLVANALSQHEILEGVASHA